MLAYVLLGAVVVVVVGCLLSEALSIHGVSWARGRCSPSSGSTSTCRGIWQVLLIVGMFIWIAIIYRGIRSRLARRVEGNMPWLFFFSALAIPAFYAVGLLAGTDTHLTVADFWRFWVVHLWVEDFLELFTTVMVAYIFVMLGVVRETHRPGRDLPRRHPVLGRRRDRHHAPPLLLRHAGGAHGAGGVLLRRRGDPADLPDGRGVGLPAARGAAGERSVGGPFPHRWAVMFLVAVGFWNFLGAGIFGFLINLPIVSYYQIGTALTANHGHAAMMGVYGMLAVGLAMFAFRYLIPEDKWPEKLARISFWWLNIGLAWMVFVSLLPLGVLQLYASVNEGYFEARSLGYFTEPGNAVLEWLPAARRRDFHRRGFLPFFWIAWQGLRHSRPVRQPTKCLRMCCSSRSSRPRPDSAEDAMTPRRVDECCWSLATRVSARRGVRLRRDGPASRGARAAVADGLVPLPRRTTTRGCAHRTSGCGPPRMTRSSRVCATGGNPRVQQLPGEDACTTSPHGREVSREIDPWPYSEAGRFHRGIACLVALWRFMPLGR